LNPTLLLLTKPVAEYIREDSSQFSLLDHLLSVILLF